MIRRWLRRHTPNADTLQRQAWARPFAHWLAHPSLWALNRRSVAGGVAAGLFCGLIPGPFQVLGSTIWAVIGKVNLPVAMLVTVYTNPVTIVPLYLLALGYGQWIVGHNGSAAPVEVPDWNWSAMIDSTRALCDWMLGMGPTLLVGLVALALTLSLAGYVLTRLAYSVGLRLAWYHRKQKRLRAQR